MNESGRGERNLYSLCFLMWKEGNYFLNCFILVSIAGMKYRVFCNVIYFEVLRYSKMILTFFYRI